MLEKTEHDAITTLLMENIEIIEFENRITDEFEDNLLKIESILNRSYILKEELTLMLKLKFLTESGKDSSLDIIKQIIFRLLEINEFKSLISDDYGIGKGGYWSFRKDFRNRELEIMGLEHEFYSTRFDCAKNIKNHDMFDAIALKFKKSLDKTNRRGWL